MQTAAHLQLPWLLPTERRQGGERCRGTAAAALLLRWRFTDRNVDRQAIKRMACCGRRPKAARGGYLNGQGSAQCLPARPMNQLSAEIACHDRAWHVRPARQQHAAHSAWTAGPSAAPATWRIVPACIASVARPRSLRESERLPSLGRGAPCCSSGGLQLYPVTGAPCAKGLESGSGPAALPPVPPTPALPAAACRSAQTRPRHRGSQLGS